MTILPVVGRRRTKIRIVIIGIYIILFLGSITMVYPFLIMLTASLSNSYDYERFSPFPKYMFNSDERYLKYLAEKYTDTRGQTRIFPIFASNYNIFFWWAGFNDISREEKVIDKHFPEIRKYQKENIKVIYDDYCEFIRGYDKTNCLVLFKRIRDLDYVDYLRKKYENLYLAKSGITRNKISKVKLEKKAIDVMFENYSGGKYRDFESMIKRDYISLFSPKDIQKWYAPSDTAEYNDYLEFLGSLPQASVVPLTGKYLWNDYLIKSGITLEEINKKLETDYKSFNEIPYPDLSGLQENSKIKDVFITFLQNKYPMRLIELKEEAAIRYIEYLSSRVKSISAYNTLCNTKYVTWKDIPIYKKAPANKLERNFWNDFVNTLGVNKKIFHSTENSYQEYIKDKYKNINELNARYKTEYKTFSDITLPISQIDWYYYETNKGYFAKFFLTYNFETIIRFIATRGRALYNTIVLCILSVLSALIVNPIAAYSLSRFNLKSTNKILIFLLATMAFPAEVAMIPGFLLLRDLKLLNTYAALIVPGMVSGFSIFLLKGFFDSLPKELYEAASIDGAKELTIFTKITMPLISPILAVIALGSFVSAYSGFMWAFLVCQDERMWTLMVWLYQFQQLFRSDPYTIMAALVLVSIPTLLMFIFCQRIILKGIIIPTMH